MRFSAVISEKYRNLPKFVGAVTLELYADNQFIANALSERQGVFYVSYYVSFAVTFRQNIAKVTDYKSLLSVNCYYGNEGEYQRNEYIRQGFYNAIVLFSFILFHNRPP